MFKEQKGKKIVYVDDLLIKNTSPKQHIKELKETFDVVKKYNMCLNPLKCTFNTGLENF